MSHLVFLAVGLGLGSVYAAMALGLLLTYKGTGVINFAAGAMGAWSAYVYADLRSGKRFVLPVGGIGLHHPMPLIPALAIAVAYAAVLGLVAHYAVSRPLRTAPPLSRVVASAGFMLAVQSLIVLRFSAEPRIVLPILPAKAVALGDLSIPRDRLWLAAIVCVLGLAAGVVFRFTRIGLAIRAAAENERFASFAGLSPDRLGGLAWAASSMVVGFVVVLAAPIVGISPTNYTLFIVPALACALVGRLRAVAPTIAAGLALGALNSELTYLSTSSWWPSWAGAGVTSAVPLVVIVASLFVAGRSLPTRDTAATVRLPAVPTPRVRPVAITVVLAAGAALVLATHGTYRFGLMTSMGVAVIALSFVVLTGLLGQVSLAQAAFAGIAGFVLSKLASSFGLGFPLAPLVAALAATIFGLIAAVPALRIRGVQLAVVTLSTAFAFEQLVLNNSQLNSSSGNVIPAPRLFGIDLGVRAGTNTARWQFGLLLLAVLVLAGLLVANLIRSATGRRFLAVRSNERASASVGIDVTRTKLLGFALASFLAGIGGSMIGYSQGSVSSVSFTTLVGITWLLFAYLGGITSVGGALVAGALAPLGIVFVIVDHLIGTSGQTYQFVAACGLVLSTISNPEGIAGAVSERRRRHRSSGPAAAVFAGAPGAADDPRLPEVQAWTPRQGGSAGNSALSISGLSVTFGAVRAVDDVSLRVDPGMIVGLIGANGAGKTTLVDAISGFVPYEGAVSLGGQQLEGTAAHRRARHGLARTWQSLELFDDLTVAENVGVAAGHPTLSASLVDLVRPGRPRNGHRVAAALELVGLGRFAEDPVPALSLGDQKLVGVARALAGDPVVILLDEPAAGLGAHETAELARALRLVAAAGIGILLIEHDTELVFELCDHIYVLDRGAVLAEGPPHVVRTSEAVVAAYLGTPVGVDQ